VAGVVGCGAGFPQLKEDVELSFNYMAMVGRQDFNYAEFAVLDEELSARGSNHILIEFEGKHAWPDDKQMVEAFKWMTVYSYSQEEVIDMALMDSLYQSDVKHLLKIENSEDLRSIVQFYKKMISLYKGLAKVEEQEKRLEMLRSSSAYKAYESELKTVLGEEMKLRSQYTRKMAQKDNKWWGKEVVKIREEIGNQSNLIVKNSRQRLLAYLSISSFMQIEAALNRGLLPQAKKLLCILDLVDPQNPDYYYLSAKLMLKQGKNERAVDLLEQATKYGFDDWETLNDERIFDPVRRYLRTIQ
jgi:tetratricopeptide (TPR) repeat protein